MNTGKNKVSQMLCGPLKEQWKQTEKQVKDKED